MDPFREMDREVHLDPGNGRELPGAEGRAEQQLGYGALIRLDCDSSPVGTGAKVSQLYKHPMLGDTWRLVNHTARAWTKTKRGYSQIKRESNWVYNRVVSNRMNLLGRPFMVVVDHKPLLPLYNGLGRPKQDRVDCHGMKLEAYRIEMKWEY